MLYLDSSAIVKLVAAEPETRALMSLLESDSERVSSALAWVEVLRAVARLERRSGLISRARQVLERIPLVRIDWPLLRKAAELRPPELRSLDAVHLVTALSLPEPPVAFVTYDLRQAEAASGAGLVVESPE